MRLLALILPASVVFISCLSRRHVEPAFHNGATERSAFFLTDRKLFIIERPECYIYNFETNTRSKPLFKAPNGYKIDVEAAGPQHGRPESSNARYAGLLLKPSAEETPPILVVIDIETGTNRQFLLPKAPQSVAFEHNDPHLSVYWPSNRVFRYDPASEKSYSVDVAGTRRQGAARAIAYTPLLNNKRAEERINKLTEGRPFQAAAQHPGDLFAIARPGRLSVYSLSNEAFRVKMPPRDEQNLLNCLKFSPAGDRILAGGAIEGQLGSLFLYDVSTGSTIGRFLGKNDKKPVAGDVN